MKYLIVSDIHGNTQLFKKIIQQNLDIDGVFFLGDGITDFHSVMMLYPTLKSYEVNGNCDFRKATCAKVANICSTNIFYVHGDIYSVKNGLAQLCKAALDRRCEVILFGHTHRPFYNFIDGVHIFNPGALGGGFDSFFYGIMELSEGEEPTFSHICAED